MCNTYGVAQATDSYDFHSEVKNILTKKPSNIAVTRTGAAEVMELIFIADQSQAEHKLGQDKLDPQTTKAFENYFKIISDNADYALTDLKTCASDKPSSAQHAILVNRCGLLLSVYYLRKYEFTTSVNYSKNAAEVISEYIGEVKDPNILLQTYDLLFTNYVYDLNQVKAEETAQISLELIKKHNLEHDTLTFVDTFMYLYNEVGLPEKSASLLNLLLDNSDNWQGEELAYIHRLAGDNRNQNGKHEKALSYYNKAIENAKDPQTFLPAKYGRIETYVQLGQIEQAEQELAYLDNELAKHPELAQALSSKRNKVLHQLSYAQGNYQQAYDLLADWANQRIEYVDNKLANNHQKTIRHMTETEMALTARAQKAELETRLAKAEIKSQRLYLTVACLSLVILIFLTGFIFSRAQKMKRQNSKLKRSNAQFNESMKKSRKHIDVLHDHLDQAADDTEDGRIKTLKNLAALSGIKKKMAVNDLLGICQQVGNEYKPHMESKAVNFNVVDNLGAGRFFWSSKFHLESILRNLLDNAVAGTNNGGNITITLSTTPKNYFGVRIEVSDNGQGFDMNRLSALYQFNEGKNIGLAVVKKCVDMFSGQVDIQSKIGSGTKVIIDLPDQANRFQDIDKAV